MNIIHTKFEYKMSSRAIFSNLQAELVFNCLGVVIMAKNSKNDYIYTYVSLFYLSPSKVYTKLHNRSNRSGNHIQIRPKESKNMMGIF